MKTIDRRVDICPEYNFNNDGFKPEEILLFDIETTGLSKMKSQIYLIGCGYLADDGWHIRQWLTASASDELSVLEEFLEFAKGFRLLVHFNGDGFDIPYINSKADFYGLEEGLEDFASFDIYKRVKPLKDICGLRKIGQRDVEAFLKIEREDKLNGGLLIPYYYSYETAGNDEDEKLLLLHNFDDIQGMFRILRILKFEQIIEGRYVFYSFEECMGTAVLEFRLDEEVPAEIDFHKNDIEICAEGTLLQINVPVRRGEARLPLTDVENYYYLPEEDRVIHKDLAQFVDRQFKRKASKKNCFLKKEGSFLPQPEQVFEPGYLFEGDKKNTYFELTDENIVNDRLLKTYAGVIIKCK